MQCSKYPERPATGTCAYCGKFFCEEYLVEVNGRNYCKDHIANVIAEAKTSAPQTQPMVFMNAGGGGGATASSSAAAAVGGLEPRRRVNHLLHFVLTMLTGVWLFVWIFLIIKER